MQVIKFLFKCFYVFVAYVFVFFAAFNIFEKTSFVATELDLILSSVLVSVLICTIFFTIIFLEDEE